MNIRVYVDWNDQDQEGRVWLTLTRSRKDLEPFKDQLREGMMLILHWDPEDPELVYEMDGILERDRATGKWMARPTEGSNRQLRK